MAKQKTRKAITKRFKITRTGKILRRPTGQDHYLAKRSPKKRRQIRKWIELSSTKREIKPRLSLNSGFICVTLIGIEI